MGLLLTGEEHIFVPCAVRSSCRSASRGRIFFAGLAAVVPLRAGCVPQDRERGQSSAQAARKARVRKGDRHYAENLKSGESIFCVWVLVG